MERPDRRNAAAGNRKHDLNEDEERGAESQEHALASEAGAECEEQQEDRREEDEIAEGVVGAEAVIPLLVGQAFRVVSLWDRPRPSWRRRTRRSPRGLPGR